MDFDFRTAILEEDYSPQLKVLLLDIMLTVPPILRVHGLSDEDILSLTSDPNLAVAALNSVSDTSAVPVDLLLDLINKKEDASPMALRIYTENNPEEAMDKLEEIIRDGRRLARNAVTLLAAVYYECGDDPVMEERIFSRNIPIKSAMHILDISSLIIPKRLRWLVYREITCQWVPSRPLGTGPGGIKPVARHRDLSPRATLSHLDPAVQQGLDFGGSAGDGFPAAVFFCDGFSGQAGPVFPGGAGEQLPEEPVQGFEIGEPIVQGDGGQCLVRSGQVVEGVLQPDPGEIVVETDAGGFFKEGRNIGAVILGESSDLFQFYFIRIVIFQIPDNVQDDGLCLLVGLRDVRCHFRGERAAEGADQHLDGGFGRITTVGTFFCQSQNGQRGVAADFPEGEVVPGSCIGDAGREGESLSLRDELFQGLGGEMKNQCPGVLCLSVGGVAGIRICQNHIPCGEEYVLPAAAEILLSGHQDI